MESIAKRAGSTARPSTDVSPTVTDLAAWAHREDPDDRHLVAAVTGRLDTPERIRAGFVADADSSDRTPSSAPWPATTRRRSSPHSAQTIRHYSDSVARWWALRFACTSDEATLSASTPTHTGEAIARLLASCLPDPRWNHRHRRLRLDPVFRRSRPGTDAHGIVARKFSAVSSAKRPPRTTVVYLSRGDVARRLGPERGHNQVLRPPGAHAAG